MAGNPLDESYVYRGINEMMRKIIVSSLLAVWVVSFGMGCQKDKDMNPSFCETSYKDDIIPLVTTACTGYCHDTWNHFEVFENIKEVVENGRLWEKLIVERSMPLYPQSITEEERELFACWIEAGGLNN